MQRISGSLAAVIALVATTLSVSCASVRANEHPTRRPTTFVIVHGAWGGGWDWLTVDSMLTARGHRVERVTLTGLGERVHLASPEIGLETHVTDVVNRIEWDRLTDVVLIGHSYGGVIVTMTADRIPDRLRRVVYIDAIIPEEGRSVADLTGRRLVDGAVAGMIPAAWESAERPVPKDVPHPLRTLTDTVHLEHVLPLVSSTYILTQQEGQLPDAFQPFADRARALGWPVRVMEADHVPERSAPAELVELLLEAAE